MPFFDVFPAHLKWGHSILFFDLFVLSLCSLSGRVSFAHSLSLSYVGVMLCLKSGANQIDPVRLGTFGFKVIVWIYCCVISETPHLTHRLWLCVLHPCLFVFFLQLCFLTLEEQKISFSRQRVTLSRTVRKLTEPISFIRDLRQSRKPTWDREREKQNNNKMESAKRKNRYK